MSIFSSIKSKIMRSEHTDHKQIHDMPFRKEKTTSGTNIDSGVNAVHHIASGFGKSEVFLLDENGDTILNANNQPVLIEKP